MNKNIISPKKKQEIIKCQQEIIKYINKENEVKRKELIKNVNYKENMIMTLVVQLYMSSKIEITTNYEYKINKPTQLT